MNNESFNKVQLNETVTTNMGNLMINIRENNLEAAILLYQKLKSRLNMDNGGKVSFTPSISLIPQKSSNSSPKTCKDCKGLLKLRDGQNGKFYGCTNFYKGCRYTERV